MKTKQITKNSLAPCPDQFWIPRICCPV